MKNAKRAEGLRSEMERREFLKLAGVSPLAAGSGGVSIPLSRAEARAGTPPKAGTLYLADLEKCQPASALAKKWKHGAWRLLEYGTDSFSGQMLLAVQDSRAPEVTYAVKRSGWYEIYIGIYRKPFTSSKRVHVRLTGDRAFSKLTGRVGEKDHQEHWIDEIFWKAAGLTGQGIVLKQITDPVVEHAWVSFIRLVPLSPEEVTALQADRGRGDTKRLFVHYDGSVIPMGDRAGTGQEVLNSLEPLRNTDVLRIYWEGGTGDTAKRFSKIATDHSMELRDPPRRGPFLQLTLRPLGGGELAGLSPKWHRSLSSGGRIRPGNRSGVSRGLSHRGVRLPALRQTTPRKGLL